MSDDTERLAERIARLEQRVAQLEHAPGRAVPAPAAAPAPPRVVDLTPPAAAVPPPPRPFITKPAPRPATEVDVEQWLGQRALLFIGIVALLAAGGFLLKYSFDHGWIPPLARAIAAVVAGIAVMVFGERLAGRGMRRYGVSLIGAGAGLAYLGVWAASGLYGLVEPRIGMLLLVAATAALVQRAIHHDSEPLAAWGLFGALLAPVIVTTPHPTAQAFFGYLDVVLVAAALLAWYFPWRIAFGLAVAGVIALAAGSTAWLSLPVGLLFLVTVGTAVLVVTERRPWPAIRGIALSAVWMLLILRAGGASPDSIERWIALAGAVALCALTMSQEQRTAVGSLTPLEAPGISLLVFVLAPSVCVVLANGSPWPSGLVVPLLLAAGYVALGWRRQALAFVGMAAALTAAGLAAVSTGMPLIVMWSALALVCVYADRVAVQPGLKPPALALAGLSWLLLLVAGQTSRPGTTPAFTDQWALTLWAYIALTAAAAAFWRTEAPQRQPGTIAAPTLASTGGVMLWTLASAALFLGVSIELDRWFGARHEAWPGADLAGRLAISLWWVLYAAAAIRIGFVLDRKPVRLAGLVVAVIATQKVWLYDLANLDALWRVAAFFALALMTLAVAYAYHRRAKKPAEVTTGR